MRYATQPESQPNNPKLRGCFASPKVCFGHLSRFCVFAVHTRFDRVAWMVADADQIDETTDGPKVIRMAWTFDEVMERIEDVGQVTA